MQEETSGPGPGETFSTSLDLPTIVREHLRSHDEDADTERDVLQDMVNSGTKVVHIDVQGRIVEWPDGEVLAENYYATYGGLQDNRPAWPPNWYNRDWFWDENEPSTTTFIQLPQELDELIRYWVMDNADQAKEWLKDLTRQRTEPPPPPP